MKWRGGRRGGNIEDRRGDQTQARVREALARSQAFQERVPQMRGPDLITKKKKKDNG